MPTSRCKQTSCQLPPTTPHGPTQRRATAKGADENTDCEVGVCSIELNHKKFYPTINLYSFHTFANFTHMPTGSTPAHTSVLEAPVTPREYVVDAIALEVATGSSRAQLAARFGYTAGGIAGLCERDDFKVRVQYYAKRLEDMKYVSQRKLLLHLPKLLDNELAVALAGQDPDTGDISVDTAAKPAAQKARQYLIDKVMPTTTRVESTVETANAPETREVLVELRNVLRRINDERSTVVDTNYSILDSPHVLEGVAALPSPLLAKAGQ